MRSVVFLTALSILSFDLSAQTASASMIVAVEPHHGAPSPRVTANDLTITVGNKREQVNNLTPVREAGVELWILIDDGAASTIGNQFSDLRNFISSLPANDWVGLGYMRNGSVVSAQPPSADHALAAKALRLPIGEAGINASPYISLTDLIHKWPATRRAREVLMVTSGIDLLYGPGPADPYLDQAVDAAQRGGVVVSSIYFGSVGHAGHSYWLITWGQNDLGEITWKTGGEFYWQGMTNPVAFGPYLDQFKQLLNEQYVVTFTVAPKGKAQLEPVKVRTEVPNVTVVAPSRVAVPGA